MSRATPLCALIALLLGCEQHRRLRCTDVDGNVVVDTTDIYNDVRQNGTSWQWEDRKGDVTFAIAVPPHSCVYKRHSVDPEETCDCPTPEEGVPLTIPPKGVKISVPFAEEPEEGP